VPQTSQTYRMPAARLRIGPQDARAAPRRRGRRIPPRRMTTKQAGATYMRRRSPT